MKVQTITQHPKMLSEAANWFSSKWGIPVESYLESMEVSIKNNPAIPRWYLVINEHYHIIAGAGIIKNDFHDRKDLSPNLCALFVEENYRNRGLAKQLLDFARKDLKQLGYDYVYLITDHTEFYEKCGWTFMTMVTGDDGQRERMYFASTL